jgi:hypothetical protein
MKLALLAGCTALLFAVAPAAAMPRAAPHELGAVTLARVICDDWGSC